MLVRLRWFLLGVLTSLGTVAYAARRVRRAREQLTPRNLARTGVYGVADLIDAAAERIAPAPPTA